ncbi:MAG: IgGFc-binding protein [Deltaproteobacteria bacterium]|nr:IgGFc-binding protein [Deltaproteobacteria bacterium]
MQLVVAAPMRPLNRTPLARAALVLALGASLAGCPEEEGKADGKDATTTLPDGATCEPNTVIACPEEGGPIAEVCLASGNTSALVTCNDHTGKENQVCANKDCRTVGSACYEGEVQACVVEGSKEALICNASGTAFQPGTCKGEDGQDSQCRGGACTACFPGVRKCLDDQNVLQCNEAGTAYELFQTCQGGGQVCTGQFCEELCERNIKFNSYIGCDYFAVDLDNAFVPGGRGFFDAAGAQFAVAVANPPDAPLPATVEIKQLEGGQVEDVLFDATGQPFPTEALQPGELRVYRLPRRDINGTMIGPQAYQVSSSVPIIAYQFNPLEDEGVFSNDASLLMPAALLGQEYFVMTREQTFNELRSYLTVVAVMEGETTVSVTVTGPTQAGKANEGAPDCPTNTTGPACEYTIAHMPPGTTKNFKLKQFDVLNLETDRPGADLTGSRIIADKRVAVFGGSEAANAPNTARCIDIDPVTEEGVCEWDKTTKCRTLLDCVNAGFNTCCADHLEHQLLPLKIWGSSHVATKSWDRGLEKDIYRIMAGDDNTRVVLVPPLPGVSIPILQRGEFFEFESASNFEIHAQDQKPIMVGQFLAAQDAPNPNVGGVASAGDAGTGDPAFFLVIPVEQYRTDFVILVPAEYAENYINVIAPTGAEVRIDGEDIPPGLFTIIGSGSYSVYRTRLADPGAHTIISSEPAGVIVYGWDQYVSYAYTGGLDLEEIRKETPFTPPAEPEN